MQLKSEEFPFKVMKRLLIRFVTPEVSQNMLTARMHWALHQLVKEMFHLYAA